MLPESLLNFAQKIIEYAQKKGLRLAVAESVTGGLIAAALTEIPGASQVFSCGVVAYQEHAKIHALGVNIGEIHAEHGYSEKTVRQMAEHVLLRNAADLSIATTGSAGPEFAVGFENGRVIFALAQRGKETKIFDEHFSGERSEVRLKATEFALGKLLGAVG